MAKGNTKAKLIVEQANARAISESVIIVKNTPMNDTTMKPREMRLAFGESARNSKL